MFGLLVLSLPLLAVQSLAAPGKDPLALIKRAEGHEVLALFEKRQSNYPAANAVPPDSSIPKAWLDKLATLQLPNVPISTGTPLPNYGARDGEKATSSICSFTYECQGPEDLYAPPAGKLAFTFDDGPSGGTDSLMQYMRENGAMGKATHFMIGSYISNDRDKFKGIASEGHIGVHTWSHQYMTTLTNNQVVAELGWTMQIISDLNGGRVPLYWRPPFGDVDNRVRAIAKGVFGLQTVLWNRDTADWQLDQGNSYTVQSVTNQYIQWLGDKSQGLNVLEHEVRPSQIEVFKNVYPRAQQMGWTVGNVADIWGRDWYQNAKTGNSTVTPMSVGAAAGSVSASSTSSSANSTSTSASANSTSTSMSASTSSAASITSITSSSSSSGSASAAAASASQSRTSGGLPMTQRASWGAVVSILGMMIVWS